MALFGKKNSDAKKDASEDVKAKKIEPVKEKAVVTKEKTTVSPELMPERDLTSVIVKPRITEKAALSIDRNVYTFEVKKHATTFEVRDAVKALYNVTPVKVNIVNKKPRHYVSRMRGRDMMEKGLKKAYVYLKKGDRIDLV